MKTAVRLALCSALTLVMLVGTAEAKPWVRKAEVSGKYAGTYKRTECTYKGGCGKQYSRLVFGFTPIDGGVRLYSYTGDYTMKLRWVPVLGYYTGRNDLGKHWKREITFHVTQQVRIDDVWTARKIKGTYDTWSKCCPKYGDSGNIALVRRS